VLAAEILAVTILALTGFAYERRARQRDNELYGRSKKLIDIGGYRLHLNCSGQGGPVVVLEYGLQGSYLDWYAVQPEIARFNRVCSYDRAGYGWSDPSPLPRVPSVMADELHTLLHAAGEKPPYILAAHSYGSFTAVMFAHRFPDQVSGLVLVDGLHTFSTFPFGLPSGCRSAPCKSWFRSASHAGVTGSEATCQRHCEAKARRPVAAQVYMVPFIGSEPTFRQPSRKCGQLPALEPFL
jgi:pimeloyl-ACP methyl ester carboxylesterase